MGDGAASLTKAVTDTFGDIDRFMCFWHLKEKVLPKIKSFSKTQQELIITDINHLKRAIDDDEFTVAGELMIESWKANGIEEVFIEYFSREYLNGPLRKWYSGCTEFGTTNNGLEKKNCTIKDTVTLRQRLPIRQLFQKLVTAAEVFSTSPDYNIEEMKITNEDYKSAYDFKQLKVKSLLL
uniref:Transposase n=1 Tax=Panagrolaimus sp. ES5 TaxID=591445 RepID=A0AC34GBY4_9BILA